MLARQLKLRLVAEEGSDIPRSCTNIVVSIHAVATFQAFNDYLRPRIVSASALADRMAAATSSSAPQAGGRLSSFLAAFAAADGSSPPPEASSSAALGARGSSSLGSEGRRRSDRLSGKGVGDEGEGEEAVGEASTSKTTLEDEMP
jgi:E3 ubiquitin-protein ligase TRIP12